MNNDNYNNNYNDSYRQYDNKTPSINRSLLETTSKWSGFLGIVTIISGVLTCLGAITTFGLSLIPGIINIILGLKLNKTKQEIENYLRGDTYAINATFENLGSYFKIQGILMIVTFVIAILFILFAVIVGISAFSSMTNTYY